MKMAGADQVHEGKALKNSEEADSCNPHQWMIMKHGNDISNSASISSSGDPTSSDMSSDVMDDATSSSSSPSYGPLYELSELMGQLPIKRGLSKYYQGKSQTFASLGCVKSLEDLAKKGRPCRRKMKACKSYGGGLDNRIHSPKATISKKSSRVSFVSSHSLGGTGRATFFCNCKSSFHVQRNF